MLEKPEQQCKADLEGNAQDAPPEQPNDAWERAAVYVVGRALSWSSRARRRNRLLHHPLEGKLRNKHHSKRFVLFSVARIRETLLNPVDQLSFSVGPIFLVGSLLFVVGCAAQTHRGYWTGEWSTRFEDDLVNIPYLVGAILFVAGTYAAVIEASNINYADQWRAWKSSGEQGAPPRIRLHPRPSADTARFIAYYGTLIQFLGAVLFLIGAVTELVGSDDSISKAVSTWLLDVPFLTGGALFVVGAYLLVSEGSYSWWRGCVPPLRTEELQSLDYWIGILNWVGSLLFLGGGVESFVSDYLTIPGKQLLNSFTWLLGSVLFSIQGVLLYLEMINHT